MFISRTICLFVNSTYLQCVILTLYLVCLVKYNCLLLTLLLELIIKPLYDMRVCFSLSGLTGSIILKNYMKPRIAKVVHQKHMVITLMRTFDLYFKKSSSSAYKESLYTYTHSRHTNISITIQNRYSLTTKNGNNSN